MSKFGRGQINDGSYSKVEERTSERERPSTEVRTKTRSRAKCELATTEPRPQHFGCRAGQVMSFRVVAYQDEVGMTSRLVVGYANVLQL